MMIKYAVYTRDRWRGDLFDDLAKAIQYAGEIAVSLGFDAEDMDITDSLQNKRRWSALDRDKKMLTEPSIELGAAAKARLEQFFQKNHLAHGNDSLWIEPGGDVHLFEAAVGCSRKLGTVDGLLRQILAESNDLANLAGMPSP